MYLRSSKLLPETVMGMRVLLLSAPLAASFLAFGQPGHKVFFVLTMFNIGIYRSLSLVVRDARIAAHFLLISAAALEAGFPENWIAPNLTTFSRPACIMLALSAYVLLRAALSRNPKLAIIAAVICGLTILGVFSKNPQAIHWAIQGGTVFLLLHSLRWIDHEHPGAALLRYLTAGVWLLHSFTWLRLGGQPWITCTIAVIVLSGYALFRILHKSWGPWILPIATMLVMLASPASATAEKAHSLPLGVLIIIGSFIFFGLGTAAALTRQRWHKPQHSEKSSPP